MDSQKKGLHIRIEVDFPAGEITKVISQVEHFILQTKREGCKWTKSASFILQTKGRSFENGG